MLYFCGGKKLKKLHRGTLQGGFSCGAEIECKNCFGSSLVYLFYMYFIGSLIKHVVDIVWNVSNEKYKYQEITQNKLLEVSFTLRNNQTTYELCSTKLAVMQHVLPRWRYFIHAIKMLYLPYSLEHYWNTNYFIDIFLSLWP